MLKKRRKELFRLFVLILVIGSIPKAGQAQDPEFSQFYANQLYLNPAFAGSKVCPRVSLNYRNQWPNVPGFVTYSASYDQYVPSLLGGLGLIVTQDVAAHTMKTTNISGIYSYRLDVNRRFSINFGVQGGWGQKSVDWSNLSFGDEIDPRRGFVYTTDEVKRDKPASFADFSAGIVGYTDNYFVGFSVHHLTEPNISVAQGGKDVILPRKFTFHAGAQIPIESKGEPMTISPNILYMAQDFDQFQQINVGLYINKGPIVAGFWYRNNDAVIALIGLKTDLINIGYSYDITISKLTNKTGGAHELSMVINFDCRPRPVRYRTLTCPSF